MWTGYTRHGYVDTDTFVSGWHVVIMLDAGISPAELAKRIVRHTFGEKYMAYIGESVGPAPDADTAYYAPDSNTLYVTQEVFDKLVLYRNAGAQVRHPQSKQRYKYLQDAYPVTTDPKVPDVFSI